MNESAAQYLAEARRLTLAALQGLPVQVFLFGSRATGDAGRHSDIDIAVLPLGELPVATLSRLRERLEESHIPYPVDVVNLANAESSLRRRVLAEGVPWNA
jgi:predicted nucleotidyltransferase